MLSILISTIIFGSLTVIYLTAQKNLITQDALITIQENSRIAMQILSLALRTAGYIGCARLTNDFPLISEIRFNENNKISPYYHDQIKPGTDGITVMRANPINAELVNNMSDYSHLVITGESQFDAKDMLLISDCESAEVFSVADVSGIDSNLQSVIAEKSLNKLYAAHAEIGYFEKNSYFVAKTERLDKSGSPIYALYVRDIYANKTELVEGVSTMKILYGVLENEYLVEKTVNQINDWSKVIGVSVMLEFDGLNASHIKRNQYIYSAL